MPRTRSTNVLAPAPLLASVAESAIPETPPELLEQISTQGQTIMEDVNDSAQAVSILLPAVDALSNAIQQPSVAEQKAQELTERELEAAFATDADEHEGDDSDTDSDGEVKASERWEGDVPAATIDNGVKCPHPKCPSNRKPRARQFKKRKEHPTEEPERKTPWGRYLYAFKKEHPEMDKHTAKVEARKTYIPESGKKKSFQRIFAEKWKANNPLWTQIKDPQELDNVIRAAFLAQV